MSSNNKYNDYTPNELRKIKKATTIAYTEERSKVLSLSDLDNKDLKELKKDYKNNLNAIKTAIKTAAAAAAASHKPRKP